MNTRFSHNTYLIIWMISSLDMFCMHEIGSLVCLVFLCAPQSPRSWPEAELHDFGLVAEMLYLYTLFIKTHFFACQIWCVYFEDAISISRQGKTFWNLSASASLFSWGVVAGHQNAALVTRCWIREFAGTCRRIRHLLTMSHPGHCPIVHRTQAIKKGTLIV